MNISDHTRQYAQTHNTRFYNSPNENQVSFPKYMTRLQTKLEDKKNLAFMSQKMELGKYFIISKQIDSLNGRNLEKIHEDVFEAFMGALFLSNGLEPCLLLLLNLLETLIDYSDKLYCDTNYKDSLLRYHHKQKWSFPKYHMIHFEGPPHKRIYIMGVQNPKLEFFNKNNKLKNQCISFGLGNSKKEGEQKAAKMSLIIHGLLKEDQYIMKDIYYPPWDKINSYDGENCILNISETSTISSTKNEFTNNNNSDSDSVYSNLSDETESDIEL